MEIDEAYKGNVEEGESIIFINGYWDVQYILIIN